MNAVSKNDLRALLESVAAVMAEKCEELCAMDAKLGDGDLGLTMKKGFGALPDIISALEEDSISRTLIKAGMKMASVVPSTMGTLMSSGIMAGGKALGSASEMDAKGFAIFLKGFCEGIVKRGKCSVGDRTVLDAFNSASDRLERALEEDQNLSLKDAGKVALEGAREGVEHTKDMVPKFGKAAVHKASAAGVADQGACAGMYMIEGMSNFFETI